MALWLDSWLVVTSGQLACSCWRLGLRRPGWMEGQLHFRGLRVFSFLTQGTNPQASAQQKLYKQEEDRPFWRLQQKMLS